MHWAALSGTEHSSCFVAEKNDPEFSMAEKKRGSLKERELGCFCLFYPEGYIPAQPI